MSGTVTPPPSVDQIQSQQITTLEAQVAALQQSTVDTATLQAQITALQTAIADIQQQLLVGPPQFSTWVITPSEII